MRGKFVRLSVVCKVNWADPGFRLRFQFFRSVDLNEDTKRCLNAPTLNLNYIWDMGLVIAEKLGSFWPIYVQ